MNRSDQKRALVFGDDMRIFLAVTRSLGRAGIQVQAVPFDWGASALKSRYVAKVHHLPRYMDGAYKWLNSVNRILDEERIDLVIPCSDTAILPLDHHRDELNQVRLAIPDRRAMEFLFDKQETKRLASELSVPVAPGGRLSAIDTAAALAARYGLPLVIKPRRSYWMDQLGSWGKVWIPRTLEELEDVLRRVEDKDRYLVEGFFVGGAGIGVSVLAREGRILQAFQHRRMREGWGGSSSYRISEAIDPELLSACERMCTAVELTGVCMFEFRRNDKTGASILLETNARFWGSCPLPIAIGVDFPRYLFDLLVDGKEHPPVDYPVGVRSRNFVLDGHNIVSSLRHLDRAGPLALLKDVGDFLLQPVGLLTGRETSDSFVADDFMPGFAELASLAGSLSNKRTRAAGVIPQRRLSDTPPTYDTKARL